MLLKSKEQNEARSRNYGERLGLYFQANVLERWIEARKILKTTEINTKSYFSAKEKLTEIRNKIDESEELKWEMRNDLLADTWTKSGFLNYLEAFHEEIQNGDTLQEAENCLNRALQYKPSWLPAQIYLAMAYLAEKQWDKAAEELNSVLGTPKQAAAPVSQTITSSS